MRVLFCTDGSKISYGALHNFSNFAQKNTIVDTICVIDWSFLPEEVIIEDTNFTNNCRNIADSILEHTQAVIENNGLVAGEKIKICGSAVESILEQLNNKAYDIIVMGSHGKKGIQIWLGSVSREVFEATKIPIYISKKHHQKKRVLFTTDGSDNAHDEVKRAIETLNFKDSEIYLCTVSENPDLLFLDGTLDTNWMLAIQTQQEIYSEQSLNLIKKILEEHALTVKESTVLRGAPAQSILNHSKEKEIDLIVLGAKTKTRLQKFLLDSVSKRVVENAESDTFVIKTNEN